jgi:hypothetical protein
LRFFLLSFFCLFGEIWASRFGGFTASRRAIRSITFALRARWFRYYPSRARPLPSVVFAALVAQNQNKKMRNIASLIFYDYKNLSSISVVGFARLLPLARKIGRACLSPSLTLMMILIKMNLR